MAEVPRVPAGTKAAGRRLWASILGEFELEEHELALLRQAVRIVDRLDALAAVVARDGETVTGASGDVRVHPALVESRQWSVPVRLARFRIAEWWDPEADPPVPDAVRYDTGSDRWVYHGGRAAPVVGCSALLGC